MVVGGVALIPGQSIHWAKGRECNFGKGGPWIGLGSFGGWARTATAAMGPSLVDRRGEGLVGRSITRALSVAAINWLASSLLGCSRVLLSGTNDNADNNNNQ